MPRKGRTAPLQDLDIRPGIDTNPINLNGREVPVAVLTTADFDATAINPLSAAFEPLGAVETHNRGHLTDVDDDGDIDLVLHFTISETGIEVANIEACLSALTFSLAEQAVASNDNPTLVEVFIDVIAAIDPAVVVNNVIDGPHRSRCGPLRFPPRHLVPRSALCRAALSRDRPPR